MLIQQPHASTDHASSLDYQVLKSQLATEKFVTARIISDSMNPVLKAGDVIVIRPLQADMQIKPFDLIVFMLQGRLTCHYVVHVNSVRDNTGEICVNTRGANNDFEDFPVPLSQVFGVVISHRLPTWMRIKESLKLWVSRR